MAFVPVTVDGIVAAVLDVAADAVTTIDGAAPDLVWVDVKAPPRTPETVCDRGSLVAWVGAGRPRHRYRSAKGCGTLTDWPVHVRWWACFPSLDDYGQIPVAARQDAAQRVNRIAGAVQQALAAWVCGTRYDGVVGMTVGESRPVDPAGGSAGREWVAIVTL